jgi:cytochrome c oxidase subunit 4
VTAATSAIPLSNVEAQWATLSPAEQTAVHQQLEELQRKDWKTLSLAEKKAGASICPHLISSPPSLVGGTRRREGTAKRRACCSCELHRTAYYVAFGPHGPRAPVNPPGTVVKIFAGVTLLVGSASLLYAGIRSMGVLVPSILYHSVLTSTLPFFFLSKTISTAPPPPKSISKEWEEATNERAKELKINPITGP